MNPMNIESGMAVEIRSEFLKPKNMNSTITTRNMPGHDAVLELVHHAADE